MHGTARKRERDRERKARQRARDRAGLRRCTILYSDVVAEALLCQSLDARMPEAEAERASRDRRKVAADLADVVEQWARLYLAKRDRA